MSDLRDEVPNAKRPRTGDTIVDVHGLEASASAEQQTTEAAGPSQQSAAKEMFGAGMQGPAGVRTDFPPVETQEVSMGDLEPGAMDRPRGVVGPEGPLDRPDPSVASDAEDAAENAAATAHSKSDNPDDVMDELEAAEAQYDQTHSASGDQDVNKIDSKTGKSAHASKDISQGIRHHARDRIQEALAKNPVSATQKDAQGVAQRLEEACFQRAETGGNPRGTYHNLAANAARLASTETDVDSIPRIAAGEPAEVASGDMTAGQETSDVHAGLQGITDKPRHAVG